MNKNAYIISGILVGAIIIVGFIYFGGKKTMTPSEENTPSNASGSVVNIGVSQGSPSAMAQTTPEAMAKAAATITYTDSGFVPSSVTIKTGETVQWVNQSNKPMWVASSPHPQHTDYPGFDELTGVEKGKSYTFTFTKVGTWKFHNHLTPKDFGSVVVK